MAKPKKAVWRKTRPDRLTKTGWIYRTEEIEVLVLAVVGPHAMVRRPGCAPFVASAKDLSYEEKS